MATTWSEGLAANRSRYGNASWHTGQLILKNASKTGPLAKISSRDCVAPSMLFSLKDGARLPDSRDCFLCFPHIGESDYSPSRCCCTKLKMSKCLISRSGKKLFTASCSSAKIWKIVDSFVSTINSRLRRFKWTSVKAPPDLCNVV